MNKMAQDQNGKEARQGLAHASTTVSLYILPDSHLLGGFIFTQALKGDSTLSGYAMIEATHGWNHQ